MKLSIEKYLDDVEAKLLLQWKNFADGKFDGDKFTPVRGVKSPPCTDWPGVLVNDAVGQFVVSGYC